MNPASATAITNPFPGLRPFREEEEHLFFGRERQVDAMANKLAERRFLAVVGTSGSGKSSLVNCGLRPALHQGRMASAGTSWRMAQFRPGNHPLAAMAKALAQDGVLFRNFEERGLPLVDIIDTTLRMSKRGLIDIYEQAALAQDVNLLVVVDQFEELFRYRQLGNGPQAGGLQADGHGFSEEATAFVKLLLELQDQKDCPIYVVLTMRSDFLGDCTQFAGLAEAINAGLYLVPRLTPEERRDAIVNPIRVQDAEIEPVLVTRLVNDVGDNPDQLSILQHALNRTWANWQEEGGKGPLALRHYEAIGTMEHALDAHAEEAFAELAAAGQEPSRRQHICEKLFQALTNKDPGGRGIRRPTTLGSLCALTKATESDTDSESELKEVIEVFRHPSRSFLMPPAGENLTAEKVIDISHESLMRVWVRLKDWVNDEAEAAQIYRRLAESASLHAQGKASMLRDPELTIYQNWKQKRQPNEAWAKRYAAGFDGAMEFLQRSVDERDAELAEQERRQQEEARRKLEEANQARVAAEDRQRAAEDRQRLLRKGLVGMGALSLVAVLSGVIAFTKFQEAKAARDVAEKKTEEALVSKATAEQEKKKALISEKTANQEKDNAVASEKKAKASEKKAKASEEKAKASQRDAELQKGRADQQTIFALQQAESATREKIRAEVNQRRAERSTRFAERNRALGFQATAQAQLSSDPFNALVLGLAAMDQLANDPGESMALADILARAITRNQQIGKVPTGQGEVLRLVELKNGDIISAGSDGSLRRWRNGQSLGQPIKTGQNWIQGLVELGNGDLISGGTDGRLRLWRDGNMQAELDTQQVQVLSLVKLRNGELISGGGDGSLRRGKAVIGEIPRTIKTDQKTIDILLELKNGELISASHDDTLQRWDANGKLLQKMNAGQDGVWSLLQLRSGDLITGGGDGTLKRWRDGKQIDAIQTDQGAVSSLVVLKNGQMISGGNDGTLRFWNADGDTLKSLGEPIKTGHGPIWNLVELRNGEVISGGLDGSLRRWRAGKAISEPISTGKSEINNLVELKNGELILAFADGSLQRWRGGKPLPGAPSIPTGQGTANSLAQLNNGELISGGTDGTLKFWDAATGMPLGEPIQADQGQVYGLAVLKNSELVSGGADGSLRRWNAATRMPLGEPIETGQVSVFSLLALRNGDLISGGRDGTLLRWRNFKKIGMPIQTGQGGVNSLMELSNGEVISVGLDGSIRRWRDGKPIGTPISLSDGKVWTLLELSNGQLISTLRDGFIRLYLQPEAAILEACRELMEHSALLHPQTDSEKAASRTCRSRGHLK